MLREHIAHALPEGVAQPLWSQLVTLDAPKGWIRVGNLRRVGEDLHFEPLCSWDGAAFEVLWHAAVVSEPEEARGTRVQFGVRREGRMWLVAESLLPDRVRLDASRAWRDGRQQRRRLLHGRGAGG